MGKLSGIFIFLLMVNIIGYILMSGMVEAGIADDNMYVSDNSMLTTLYSPATTGVNDTVYILDNETSALILGVPTSTPTSLIQQGLTFVDRIFVLFDFVRVMLGVLLFPIALISFMGIPWQLSMMLFPALTALYALGMIDLLSGGSS